MPSDSLKENFSKRPSDGPRRALMGYFGLVT
jgi:hypothetical protein